MDLYAGSPLQVIPQDTKESEVTDMHISQKLSNIENVKVGSIK